MREKRYVIRRKRARERKKNCNKSVLYWKTMLKECAVDRVDMEKACSDRDGCKHCVNERMKHLDKWELQGQGYV